MTEPCFRLHSNTDWPSLTAGPTIHVRFLSLKPSGRIVSEDRCLSLCVCTRARMAQCGSEHWQTVCSDMTLKRTNLYIFPVLHVLILQQSRKMSQAVFGSARSTDSANMTDRTMTSQTGLQMMESVATSSMTGLPALFQTEDSFLEVHTDLPSSILNM